MPNGLNPDQEWANVGPDLGPNCLQKDISRQSKEIINNSINYTLYLLRNFQYPYIFINNIGPDQQFF